MKRGYNLKDETGNRYGYLTVIRRSDRKRNYTEWVCKCDCGNEIIAMGTDLRAGKYVSCGCKRKEGYRKTHGMCKTRLYKTWCDMKARCYRKNAKGYEFYGARGISVCDEWKNSFESFRDWALVNGYDDSLTIDRIDVNGNYCPENCRWLTIQEQLRNTRKNVFITIDNKRLTIKEWADVLGVNPGTLYSRKERGWNDVDVLTKPIPKRIRSMK